MKAFQKLAVIALTGVLAFTLVACSTPASEDATTQAPEATTAAAASEAAEKIEGEVLIDGSSTVFPLAEAVVEEFNAENKDVRVTVGVSGTGGGFKKFAAGETDISNASRGIKDSEKEALKTANIEYVEIKYILID